MQWNAGGRQNLKLPYLNVIHSNSIVSIGKDVGRKNFYSIDRFSLNKRKKIKKNM